MNYEDHKRIIEQLTCVRDEAQEALEVQLQLAEKDLCSCCPDDEGMHDNFCTYLILLEDL